MQTQQEQTVREEIEEALRGDIRRLLVGPVVRRFYDLRNERDGLLLGDYALHPFEDGGWVITHRSSGLCGKSVSTPIEAIIQIGIMLGSGANMSVFDEHYDPKAPPRMSPAVKTRIREAMATLKSWDLDIDYEEVE